MAEVREAIPTKLADLTPHPRNYRGHPEDQIDHLVVSIEENGFYKNVIVSSDAFTLAGHGAVIAAERVGLVEIPAVWMPFDHKDPRAIKIVVADNMIENLADDDDRRLAELLREVDDADSLFGTGFDEMMLAAYEEVIRPPDQLTDFDPVAEWEAQGMPEFEVQTDSLRLVLHFDDPADRDYVAAQLGVYITNKEGTVWSAPYPPVDGRADRSSVMIEG